MRPITVERIAAIKVRDDNRVFPWPYCISYIWTKYGKILEEAGLPNCRRGKWHKIRRSCASDFEAAGGNATELLDHSSRKVTLAYLDPRVIKNVQPADICPGIGEKDAPKPGNASTDPDDEELRKFREFMRWRNEGDKGGTA